MVDLSAIARWPNVPACYGWLSLDRRGDWRLQGERVTHRGLIDFMNRQYAADERGCWFVQNGPQRVFVELACTPWIFRLSGDALLAHTGQPAGDIKAVFLDDEGSLLIEAEAGIGLLDDRDLPLVLGECTGANGAAASDDEFAAALAGDPDKLRWRGHAVGPLGPAKAQERFGFNPSPTP